MKRIHHLEVLENNEANAKASKSSTITVISYKRDRATATKAMKPRHLEKSFDYTTPGAGLPMIHVISSSQPATSVLKVVSTHLLKLCLFMVHSIRQRCCSSIKQHLYAATPIVVCFGGDSIFDAAHCGFCVPNAECVDVSLFVLRLALSSLF